MLANAYLVFPKEDAFKYKSDSEKREVESTVKFWLQILKQTNLPLCCFAEDILAMTLLESDEEIKWVSIADETDIRFMGNSLHWLSDTYYQKSKQKIDASWIAEAVKKYKPANPRTVSKEEYLKTRVEVLRKRIRYVCNKTLSNATIVVYLDANNNYCNLPQVTLGNGQLVCRVHYITNVSSECYVGGVPVDRSLFIRALEDIYANNP